MDPSFNNEEWARAPGSLASSEWTDNDGYPLYSEVQSSAGVTSLSSDLHQQEYIWMPELDRQAPNPPEKFASDLAGINPQYDGPDGDIPQTLEGDLGSSIVTERAADDLGNGNTALRPARDVHTLPGVIGRTAMGIPSPTPLVLQDSLDGAIYQVFHAYTALASGESIPDQLSQALQNLIKTYSHTKIPAPPMSLNDSAESDKELTSVLPADVEETRRRYVPPANCPLCPEETPSWRVFFNHIKVHCLITAGSGDVSTNGDQSRRDDNNDGNGEPSNQPNNWNGDPAYFNTNSGDFSSRNNAQPDPIPQAACRPNNVTGEHLIGGMPPSSFGSRTNPPRGADGQSQTQPPQNPGLPRSKPSTKRKRSNKQKPPAEEKAPDLGKCRQCDHPMTTCQLCISVRRCHKCGGMSRSAIQPGGSSTMHVPALPDESTLVDLNLPYRNPSVNYEMPQHMPTQQSNYDYYHGLYVDPRAFGGMNNTYMGNPPPDGSYARMAMVPESYPILSDLSHKVQESAVFESDTKLLRSVGLGTSADLLSIKGHAKEMREKAPGGLGGPGLYTDLVFSTKGSPVILEIPQPAFSCQCPCMRVPTVDYKTHAKVNLSPNERVEMLFQMTPESGSTHPLRTRVRVFVKLFTLRASAAQSKAKLSTHSITSEATPANDAYSDSDSDQGLSPTSPSGSEMIPPFYWTEVRNCSISFELNWVIFKIAQWTSGINPDTCQKLLFSDPSHVLRLISIYILLVFKDSWLSKGRIGPSLF
ncbi:hypothetical protein N7517_004644 [Penicillium concentricum]|uniref:Uncharacterized protein n=1 Tax=Penicillium concentricum TaxID=293559 RepID=A0A9W9V8C5_9EURO|nr:uncharacterized protein N7517_004644 [Penicillium concentricum]KAJ5372638.1 hypothetical protein N7517_004644 [Penicillium concentricum]